MKLFKAKTTVRGMREPFVDWYECETLDAARIQHEAEARKHGLPMDERRTVEFVECSPETLKPCVS